MSDGARNWPHEWDPQPRWPAFVAVLSVGGIYAALPRYLVLGPRAADSPRRAEAPPAAKEVAFSAGQG